MAEINFEKEYYNVKQKYDIALKMIDNLEKIVENNRSIIDTLKKIINNKDEQIESYKEITKTADEIVKLFGKNVSEG